MSTLPFNACDYLCEKCPETGNCSIYSLLQDKVLSKQLDGALRRPTYASLEDVKESLDETIDLLKRLAHSLGLELDGSADEMGDLDRSYVENDDLYRLALTFTIKSFAFLKRIDPFIKHGLRDAFEDVVWYHTMVAVKTHRAISSDYSGLSEDAAVSAGVAVKSLTKCIDALGIIGKSCPPATDEARVLGKSALLIRLQIKKRFLRGAADA